MPHAMQLGLLLLCLCFVVACSGFPRDGHYRLEMEEKTWNCHNKPSSDFENHDDQKRRLIRCFICRRLVGRVMPSVSHKIHKKLFKACYDLIPSLRKSCFVQAIKVHHELMDFLFPGGTPREMCIILDMC